jgi:alpha-1,2-mannosyltransferase
LQNSFIVRTLRDAVWLDSARANGYARILLAISFTALAALAVMSPNGVDPRGEPLGTDFSNVWTAAKLALSGHPASVYDTAAQQALQRETFGDKSGFYPFFYPPIYLLICWPLALMPYLVALAVWLSATGAAYVAVVRKIGAPSIGLVAILAFPAVFVTIGHGQNAFFTTALLGGGAMLLDRRPILAGVLLGCLAYKPHLAMVAPVALIAMGRWRTLASAAATAILLCLLSLAVFGVDTWKAFFASAPLIRAVLDQQLLSVEKLQSAYGAVRLVGGGSAVAYAVQGGVTVCTLGALFVLLRKPMSSGARGALIATAACLTSPYVLDYDLALLAIPLAWMAAEAIRSDWLPWEKAILALAFTLPAFSRALAGAVYIPAAPCVIALLFCCVARRATLDFNPALRGVAAGESVLRSV